METWIQNNGYNPRGWDWLDGDEEYPIAVSFEPFNGVWPIYCDCHWIVDELAVLHIPEKKEETFSHTDWFAPREECWIITLEKFIQPQ
jgi:hypothetical protein